MSLQNVNTETILKQVVEYHSKKLAIHGATPAGLDWNGEKGQHLRFEQLAKVITDNENFTLTDVGCGYGDLLSFLLAREYDHFKYTGIDVSEEMIEKAKDLNRDHENSQFFMGSRCPEITDYCIASGIFNLKFNASDRDLEKYILETLEHMHSSSKKGFSCNFLTSYSDVHLRKENLYYADPLFYFDYCKKHFSRNVALLHDYDLYDFTLLVRKS